MLVKFAKFARIAIVNVASSDQVNKDRNRGAADRLARA